MSHPVPFVARVFLRNYKSIGRCGVELKPLTMLVGRNAAGKSNFLDALRFVKDSLDETLEQAVRSRGGVDGVRRRSPGHPHNFTISLELHLSDVSYAKYLFEIAARKGGGFLVKREELELYDTHYNPTDWFKLQDGEIKEASRVLPPPQPDRLHLVAASALVEFRPAFDALTSMGFYNLNPQAMRQPQAPDRGDQLSRDGANVASVVAALEIGSSETHERLREYLATIVPGVEGFGRKSIGGYETLELKQAMKGVKNPWNFDAISMSDGTLRALGILVAAYQFARGNRPIRLVGIEEPESALHPKAAGALLDALREASEKTQLLITTHSADLLDDREIDPASLLVVSMTGGETSIAPPDATTVQAIRDHLYTAGELQRQEHLAPDPTAKTPSLFENAEQG